MDEVASLKATIQDGEAAEKRLDQESLDLLAAIPNVPAADVPVGPDDSANSSCARWATSRVRLSAEAAFRARRRSRSHGFRDRGETVRLALRCAQGPLARLDARWRNSCSPAHQRPRLYRDRSAAAGAYDTMSDGPVAEVQGRPVPRRKDGGGCQSSFECLAVRVEQLAGNRSRPSRTRFDGRPNGGVGGKNPAFVREFNAALGKDRFWLISTAEVPLTNLVREDITEEAKLPIRVDRLDAVLPRRSRRRRQGHPRHDPPASISEGGARLHHHP